MLWLRFKSKVHAKQYAPISFMDLAHFQMDLPTEL